MLKGHSGRKLFPRFSLKKLCQIWRPTLPNLSFLHSSVRRILKRGGARNFRKFERNIDQNLKLSYSNFVPFFAQNQVISSPKPDAQFAKGGPCLDFAHFSMQFCNHGDPKGGGHGPMAPPLNTPLFLQPFVPKIQQIWFPLRKAFSP